MSTNKRYVYLWYNSSKHVCAHRRLSNKHIAKISLAHKLFAKLIFFPLIFNCFVYNCARVCFLFHGACIYLSICLFFSAQSRAPATYWEQCTVKRGTTTEQRSTSSTFVEWISFVSKLAYAHILLHQIKYWKTYQYFLDKTKIAKGKKMDESWFPNVWLCLCLLPWLFKQKPSLLSLPGLFHEPMSHEKE